MKELQKYSVVTLYKLGNINLEYPVVYLASEADAAFAEMRREHHVKVNEVISQGNAEIAALRREHAEHIARIEASTIELQRSLEQKLQQSKQAVMREHVQALIEQRDTDSGRLHKIFDAEIERLKREHAEEIERLKWPTSYRAGVEAVVAEIRENHAQEIYELNAATIVMAGEVSRLRKQAERYEKLRRLNVRDFQALYMRNIRGEGLFDALVDQLTASGEASEEEQHGRVE